MSYVLNMISFVLVGFHTIISYAHVRVIWKISIYMISYLYHFRCIWNPLWFHMFPRACPGRFKSCPYPVQMHPGKGLVWITCSLCQSPTSVCPLWLCSGLLVHWGTLGSHPLFPRLGDLAIIILMCRSMMARLQCGSILLHNFTLEKVGVGRVDRQLQDLENDVSVHLTKASALVTWYAG